MVEKYVLLEKAAKLYRLSKSDNPNESLVAFNKMKAFLIKHNLSIQEVIDNDICVFELEKETKYDILLFNHLLLVSVQDSPDLLKKVGVVQLSDTKCNYKLTKYLFDSMIMKYNRIVEAYKEDLIKVKEQIDRDNSTPVKEAYYEIPGVGYISFGTPQKTKIVFEEDLFFISFIKKYKLIPKPRPQATDNKDIQLTEEKVRMILEMEKMYSKRNVDQGELDQFGNKLGTNF